MAFLPGRSVAAFLTALQVGGIGGHAGFVAAADLLVGSDVGAKGRIGQHQVETAIEDAVDVEQAIVIVDAAVPVAVHDHVHLGGTRGARLGIGAVDALPRQSPDAGVDGLVVVAAG